ncbi:MAG: VIT1/CCC1 transporter family protein [Eubacteriales bacterium]
MKKGLLIEQKNEITAHHLYNKLSENIKNRKNAHILKMISDDELKHYYKLKVLTNEDVKPNRVKIFIFYWICRILGLTFGLKLLENGEDSAIKSYQQLSADFLEISTLLQDEEEHERLLIDMVNEEKLNYMGSVVLGLNDALVELTGALAGYTFAFQNTRLIAIIGLITGISASFSMAASEYLSTVHETEKKEEARKAAIYTGIAYVLTVIILISPFMVIFNPFHSLLATLVLAVIIIFIFNYYISVAKGTPFRSRFLQMVSISLGVSGISFLVGVLVKKVFGIAL